ncbi:hypothetical protein G9A89_005017 [Geosiphon pyriformis]|nr:hypothetical protein G9A89_005017 [Geosiphon pyriformis]
MSFRLPRFIPIISLLHNPNNAKSTAALNILQSVHRKNEDSFKVDIINYDQQPVVKQQLMTIVEYLGVGSDFAKVLEQNNGDAKIEGNEKPLSEKDAPKTTDDFLRIVNQDSNRLKYPIVVDWEQGKAIFAHPPEKVIDFLEELGYIKE